MADRYPVTKVHAEARTEKHEGNATLRVVLLHTNLTHLSVATMPPGGELAEAEITFQIDEAIWICRRILAGDMRAATRPGMARMLAATVMALNICALQAGGIEQNPVEPLGEVDADA